MLYFIMWWGRFCCWWWWWCWCWWDDDVGDDTGDGDGGGDHWYDNGDHGKSEMMTTIGITMRHILFCWSWLISVWNPAISAEFTEEPLQRSRFNLDQGDVYRRPTSDLLSSERHREQWETFPLMGLKFGRPPVLAQPALLSLSIFIFYLYLYPFIFHPGNVNGNKEKLFHSWGWNLDSFKF